MKINIQTFDELVEQKYLSRHERDDLLLYNYTHRAQNEQYWTDETKMARGLIVRKDGTIVARPFPKFFNLSEHESPNLPNIPNERFEVYDKFDGSLGILYWHKNTPYLATRGSFESEQSQEGTRILHERYKHVLLNPSFTYLFEIIYPENRIVVDYGQMRNIVLLAVIDTEGGYELPYEQVIRDYGKEFIIVPRIMAGGLHDPQGLLSLPGENKEGYVLRFVPSGMRVKVKYDEYVRLHRIVTGLTKRRVWDLLKNGEWDDSLFDKVPEEFKQWLDQTKAELLEGFNTLAVQTGTVVYEAKEFETRKEQADYILDRADVPGAAFAMLDGRNDKWKDALWKSLKPKAEKPFREDES